MVPPESPCTERVHGHFVHREREVSSTFGEGALRTSEFRNHVTDAPEVVARRRMTSMLAAGTACRAARSTAWRSCRPLRTSHSPTPPRPAATNGWSRRLVDHRGWQRIRVVGAEQPEVGIVEREVEERFVPVALGQRRRAPAGPDRFADPTEPDSGTSVLGDESLPRGDDACRVLPDRGHVGELHVVAVELSAPCRSAILSASSTTSIGSSASTAPSMNPSTPAMNSSWPA